jgi:hypothetical protein
VGRDRRPPLQRSKGGFKTRAAAHEHLTTVLAAKKDATYVPPVGDTFGSYLVDSWLPAQRQRLRESTFDDYRRRIDNYFGLVAATSAAARRRARRETEALAAPQWRPLGRCASSPPRQQPHRRQS